jgi:F-type H+-transporting ATPase subunit b
VNFNLTLIGQTISFIVVVWFTMKFVWPLLIGKMEQREKIIADGLAAAQRGQEELEQAQRRHGELVEEGKKQAVEVIAQAQKRGDEIVEESKDTAHGEAHRILEAARAEIVQEREQAREELKAQVATLALSGAEQILMREVDRKAHNDVLEKISASL